MTESNSDAEAIVFVIDDDAAMRAALENLFGAVGLEAQCYRSAEQFLAAYRSDAPSCLVLDVRLPGVSGLNFQDELVRAGIAMPIIFITAHGDIPMSVRAMKAGAIEFLTKPFRDQELLDAVQFALKQDAARCDKRRSAARVLASFATLTPREREIMAFVVTGLMNKQIAGRMALAEITVKIHRANLMRKMEARSVAELVRMAQAVAEDGAPVTHTPV